MKNSPLLPLLLLLTAFYLVVTTALTMVRLYCYLISLGVNMLIEDNPHLAAKLCLTTNR